MKLNRFGLSMKTSAICGAVVLILLGISSVVFLRLESGLAGAIIDEYVHKVEKTIDEEGAIQKKALDESMKARADICSAISAPFLYNIDAKGLHHALMPYMNLNEIRAIELHDYVDKPFFAFWRDSGVQTGTALPESFDRKNNASYSKKSVYQEENVGKVTVYFTDAVLTARLKQSKANANKDIEAFRETTDGKLHNVIVLQSLILFGILVILVATISLTLKYFAVRPLMRIISGLSEASRHVTSASNQLSDASESLSHGSSEQAASIEETSSSLEEMSSITRKNADHADQAKAMMGEVQAIIQKVDGNMESLAESIEVVTKSSNETDKIVKTIDEIAFQTNLLALNAAVEAARAGEAGAGFAVVADEVRNLAMRAADAAKNTAELIGGTISAVEAGREITRTTKDSFRENVEISGKVNNLVEEIAAASREQAEGIGQLNTAVVEMDKVVQNNAATAEESSSSAQEMKAQAGVMGQMVVDLMAVVGGSSGRGSESPDRDISGTAVSEAAQPGPMPSAGKGGGSFPEESGDDLKDF